MQSYFDPPAIERAQPWLGTLVSIRVSGLAAGRAHHAIDAAFAEIATVHQRMSFHKIDSDVGRLNRKASRGPVGVHHYTLEVLRLAVEIAARSYGCFDVSVGAELVDGELLPRPGGERPCHDSSWRDIDFRPDGRVAFHRPLWIDLGGMAKGYAVDRAAERLLEWGVPNAVVNAGGDLRVIGRQTECIALQLAFPTNPVPILELADGSAASSSCYSRRRWRNGRLCGPHFHGARRSPAPVDRFVCVVAEPASSRMP